MMDFLLRVCGAFLVCVGIVQVISWLFVRAGTRKATIFRVFPVTQANAGKQMSAMYTCAQWEAKAAREIYVLYDVGLDTQGVHDCEVLSQGTGIAFVHRGELEPFLTLPMQ